MPHQGEQALRQTDTTDKAWRRYVQRVRETPPAERLARAFELSRRARAATMADVRRQHPNATPRELSLAFLARVYGDALAARVARHLERR